MQRLLVALTLEGRLGILVGLKGFYKRSSKGGTYEDFCNFDT